MRITRRNSAAALATALVLAPIALAGCGGGGGSEITVEPTPTSGGGETPTGDAAAGAQVFASAGCTGCHTLEAAGATGTVGPNLDDAKPDFDLVVNRVNEGGGGMPSFKGQLSAQQIDDVAAYVVASTG